MSIISAPHPSAGCCSLTTSERLVTASGASPFIFVRQAVATAWQFASDCFPFSPSASSSLDRGWMVKWSTHAKIHTQAQSNSPSTQKLAEAERREAIFHCYYEPRERSANTTDLYSGSPLAREQVCVSVCGGLLFAADAHSCNRIYFRK